MSRSVNEIFSLAVSERNKRFELREFKNESKMSIMNGLFWVASAIVHSFETLMDTFIVDISEAMNSRVNGTPDYYAKVLLQYQKGDTLSVRSDGLAFGYPAVNEAKRIISQVSYTESYNGSNRDYQLTFKTATGAIGALQPVSKEDLVAINAYVRNFAFAGTNLSVISQQGDVLVPKLTVYYDGSVAEGEMYDALVNALNLHINNLDFDSSIYVSKISETLKAVPHVKDVYIDESEEQGVFLARYDMDDVIYSVDKIARVGHASSGFIRESSKTGAETDLPNFRESIKLIVGK